LSTKVTLNHGPGHHLYFDLFEPEKVFLRLSGADFEARPGCVTVAIPIEVWRTIAAAQVRPGDFWDDEDIAAARAVVEGEG
jgi:hypothetical protein